MTDPIRIAILGVGGRMGRAVAALALSDARFIVVAAHARAGSACIGNDVGALAGMASCGVAVTTDLPGSIDAADVVIDFTRPELAVLALEECARQGKALVSGTTGLSASQHDTFEQAAARTAVLWSPNMSVGVNLLLDALADVAARLGEDYDAEIVETHHRHKMDAPSGTAIALGEVLAAARGKPLAELADYNRHARREARQPGRIGMHSLRGGEIVGEHDVRLIAAGEELRFGHSAFSRDAFAGGALRAAAWLHGREPGLYGMRDVLDIGEPR